MNDVTAVICNFKTLDLTRRCVDSLRTCYPDLRLVLVDDGSRDASTEYIRALGEEERTEAVLREKNGGHGAALNDGLERVITHLAFTFDSDATMEACGLLESMRERFMMEPLLFAVGELVEVYDRPIYVRPAAMLMSVELFRMLDARFMLHGAPALRVMVEVAERGWLVEEFPVYDYVDQHGGSGTRKALRRKIKAGEIKASEVDRWQPRIKRYFQSRLGKWLR